MPRPSAPRPETTPLPKAGLWALGGLYLLAIALSWLDDSTEITPAHDGLQTLGFLAALAVGAACAPVGWRFASASRLPSRVIAVGLVPAMFAFSSAIDLATGMADFPPAQTRQFQALLPIASARYRQRKGRFCARVIVQQAGDAIRVLHAGKSTLPQGRIILCPPATEPSLPVI